MDYEKSLQDIVFNMLCGNKHTFYALYLAELNKGFSDIPTACVGKHPNSPNIMLYLGKHFWEKICTSDSMRTGVVIHELEHVIREHLTMSAEHMFPDRNLANIAMDISINQDISEELPRVVPKGQELQGLKEGEKIGCFIDDFPELNLKHNESSLYYYGELVKAKEKKQQSKDKGEDSKSPHEQPGNGKGTSGSPYFDSFMDAEDRGDLQDWHSKWEEVTKGMTDKEKELLKKEIQEAVRRTVEEVQKTQGHVPTHIANAVKENFGIKPPVISWKTLFNRFVGSTLTTDIKQTRKRPNFRYEDAPTNKYINKVKIVVGTDTSGSISEQELKEFFGQIKHMWKAGVKVDICLWDAHCDDPYEYKGENTYKRTKCGGTRASSFTEYINEHKNKHNWTCAIGLTDGYVEGEVTNSKIPMLWVITPGGSTTFQNKATKIKMN